MSSGLPVMLNIAGRMCVVVGGGNVATRKITDLLEVDARIILISPEIADPIKNLLEHIHWEQRPYTPGTLGPYRPILVYAATNDTHVNRQVAQEAQALGALVNVADGTYESSFSNMTAIRRPPLIIALHTGGTSPALANHLGGVLEACIGEEYTILARWLGDLRSSSREQLDTQMQRQQLYEAILESDILHLLRQQQTDRARQQFDKIAQVRGIHS
jgi:precorrin-2 dehydrogenase/sirohydrochlorin ferrochelatase